MRISSDQQYRRLVDNITGAQSRMADLQGQLSSGKRINSPSDDPFGISSVMAFRSARSLSEQYRMNAEAARSNMRLAESALGQMGELMKNANTLVIHGANGATSQEGRQAMAAEISRLQEQLLASANAKDSSGSYMFAGFVTDTKPFVPNPTPPPPVIYQGDAGLKVIDIGPSSAVAGNVLADTQVLNAYNALEDARTRLLAGDTSGLSGVSLQLVQDSLKELNSLRGDVGADLQRFDDAAKTAQRRSDDFTAAISKIEDADIAEVAVGLQAAQNAYQSALAAFSTVNQTSLLSFLK